jgi:uncharacterized membrane protein
MPSPIQHAPATPRFPREVYVLLALAAGLLVGNVLLFGLLGLIHPEPYRNVWALVVAHFTGGRMANALLGAKLGFSNAFILYQSCMVDLIVMLFAYPLFLMGYERFARIPVLGTAIASAHEMAMRHHERVRPLGTAGVLLFVITPIWGTGPLVGVIVGYILDLGTLRTFGTVVTGNTIAAIVWILFFDRISATMERYNAMLAYIVLGAMVLVVSGGIIAGWWRKRREVARANRS